MAIMSTDPKTCCVCHRAEDKTLNERKKFTVELRPYGPGGADICHDCAFATPEQRAQTAGAFKALLEANEAVSPVGAAMIGASDGPVPFDPDAMPDGAVYKELK